MGVDRSFARAFWKSQLASGNALPRTGRCFISVRDEDKPAAAELARRMVALGFELIATRGTAQYLQERGIPTDMVLKVAEGRPHVVDKILDGAIHLVFNTTAGKKELQDSYSIRRETLNRGIPYFTTIAGARAAVTSLEETLHGEVDLFPIQELYRFNGVKHTG